jgi:hypothetical protein
MSVRIGVRNAVRNRPNEGAIASARPNVRTNPLKGGSYGRFGVGTRWPIRTLRTLDPIDRRKAAAAGPPETRRMRVRRGAIAVQAAVPKVSSRMESTR